MSTTHFTIGMNVCHKNITGEILTLKRINGDVLTLSSNIFRPVPLNNPTNTHIVKASNVIPVQVLNISCDSPLSSQLVKITGDTWNVHDFENAFDPAGELTTERAFRHKATGLNFYVAPSN